MTSIPLDRRATSLAILFLLIASPCDALQEALSEEASWRNLEAHADGFSVELPGPPEFISKTFSTLAGAVTEKAYRVRFGGGFFSVELHELPRLTRLAPARIVLKKAGNEILEDRSAEKLSFRMERAGGHPASILTFRSPKSGFGFEEAHLVLVGRRLFMLTAGLAKEGDDRSAMDRFFNSFRVWK